MLHHTLLALALGALTAAVPTIEVKGSKFFTSDGNQFYVKGNSEFAPISSLQSQEAVDGGTG